MFKHWCLSVMHPRLHRARNEMCMCIAGSHTCLHAGVTQREVGVVVAQLLQDEVYDALPHLLSYMMVLGGLFASLASSSTANKRHM